MIHFFIIMFLALCWIRGFHFLFLPGEILGKVGEKIRLRVIDWVTKPLFDCSYCMSSVHGTIFFFSFLNTHTFYMWPVFCVALCGLVYLTDRK